MYVLLVLIAFIFAFSETGEKGTQKPADVQETEEVRKEEPTPEPVVPEEKKQEEGPSRIEKIYISRLGEGERIRQFGYDIFREVTYPSPLPVGSEYILGPGDELVVYLWGDPVDILGLDSLYELTVDREGRVFIPSIGSVYVWGRTVGEFKTALRELLSRRFKRFRVDVSVGRLRSFPVYVFGFVKRPGPVTATGTDTVIEVLARAGGVLKEGSLRNITIRRGGREIKVDLYRFLLEGEPVNVRVKDGDVVYVPPIGKTAAVWGAVKRPGIYEFVEGEGVEDLFRFAGGFVPSAYTKAITVIRYEDNTLKVLEMSPGGEFSLRDGDLIVVRDVYEEMVFGKVKVEGFVSYPGVYSLTETKTVGELLKKVGLLPETNLYYAEIHRKEPPDFRERIVVFAPIDVLEGREDLELRDLDTVRFFPKWVYRPVEVSGEVESPAVIPYYEGITLLDVLREVKLKGKPRELKATVFTGQEVAFSVYIYDLLVKGKGNTELNPGDRVVIERTGVHEKGPSVTVLGEVKRPGVYRLEEGMTLYELLVKAGGYTERAFPQGLILIRESVRQLQESQLEVSLSLLEESLLRDEETAEAGVSPEEREAFRVAVRRYRELLRVIRSRAKIGLGRISLDVPSDLEKLKESPANVPLEDGDYIYVPPRPGYVLILGDVYNQVALPYEEGKTLADYLEAVGGPGKDADLENVYVIKANGRVVSRRNYRRFLTFRWERNRLYFGRDFMDMVLEEGDTVVIPTKFRVPTQWRPLIRDVVQIIFQAISTAVLAKRL
ncbi:MAG: SLBB domain-containing protein [Aquificota bacterium]|nr:SLBB domain-containing protein [Aquificota bacterium]